MDDLLRLVPILAVFLYPIYLLMMAGVLAICGVPRKEIAKWALRQAGRQRATDLIRAARGLDALPESHPASTDIRAADSCEAGTDMPGPGGRSETPAN